MENMPPRLKIELYAQRGFGEKITAACNFITQNWRVIFKYFTVLFLPIAIIQALGMGSLMSIMLTNAPAIEAGTVTGTDVSGIFVSYLLTVICTLVGSMLLSAFVYSLMLLYADRPEGLQGITFADLKPYLRRNMKQSVKAVLYLFGLILIVGVIMGLVAVVSEVLLVLLVLVLLVCAVPLMLFVPAYLLNRDYPGGIATLQLCFGKGFRFWGGTCLIMLVTALIAGVVQGVFSAPWYIVYALNMVFNFEAGGARLEVGLAMSIVVFFFGILQAYGTYLGSILPALAVGYQYGHMREKLEAVSVDTKIENFEQL